MGRDHDTAKWRRYLRFWGAQPETDLADEFRFHIETEIELLIAQGMSPIEARERALERFGDVNRSLRDCRALDARRLRRVRRARLFDVLRQDARHTVRRLVSRPAFTATVVLTLALGVGANAAVFSIVDRVFLRPPEGVEDPEGLRRVYRLRSTTAERPSGLGRPVWGAQAVRWAFNLPETRDLEAFLGGRASVVAYQLDRRTSLEITAGTARSAVAAWVTPNFFRVLGARIQPGRDFVDDDVRFGEPAPVAIISSSLWRRELRADAAAIGRTIRVNGAPLTIAGVAPEGFTGVDVNAAEIWLPIGGFSGFDPYSGGWFSGFGPGSERWWETRGTYTWQLFGRVPRGMSEEQFTLLVQEGLRASVREARRTDPRLARASDTAALVRTGPIIAARGPGAISHETSISVLLAGVAMLVLIIAAANVGNLLLGRALQRRRETALSLALGISTARLIGQILLEAVILSLLSAGAAILAAQWVGGALRGLLLPTVMWAGSAADGRVALFTFGLAIAGGVAAGLVSVREALRVDLAVALKGDARTGGGRRSRLRGFLVGLQASVSLILLVGTGLFARSLVNIRTVDLGYDVERLITVSARDNDDARRLAEVAEFARSLPGVMSVARTGLAPLEGRLGVRLYGPGGDTVRISGAFGSYMQVEPNYLATVGTRIIRGRDLSPGDRIGAQPVMVVSEEFARLAWPGRGALGECLRLGGAAAPCYTVVGIVENAHGVRVEEEPSAVLYVSLDQRPGPRDDGPEAEGLVVRTVGDPSRVLRELRRVRGDTVVGSSQPAELMSEKLAPQYRPWELGVRLFAGFAVLALVVASLGLYSVVAYSVAMRRHELGVRAALGAQGSSLASLVMWEGLRQVVLGILAGVAIVVAGAGVLSGQLYEVSPRDPVIIGSAVFALLISAGLATLIPVRRAVRADPMVALRSE